MVFRGKPSKACERCRVRRLKCDLRSSACGQCVRASVPCSGYRDTQQLRIRNESQSVIKKALRNATIFEPRSLPLSLDLQARDAFFAYYVTGTTTCWDFLKRYYHPTDSPDHLTVAIDAASLAHLWHLAYSDAALATARERYTLALRMMNKSLKSSKEATKDTTLLTPLVLDLFERITNAEPQNNKSWISHLSGALALVKLRGLDQFQDPSEFPILARLSGYHLISCVASGSPVPDELIAIRSHVGKYRDIHNPKWQLTDLMVQYANFRCEIRRGILSNDDCIGASKGLDKNLEALDVDIPLSWKYSTTLLDKKSDKIFDLHFDSYPDREATQIRNLLRTIRILLNESLVEYYLLSPRDDKYLVLLGVAHDNIKKLVGEICASVPQYVDCDSAARRRLPISEMSGFPYETSDDLLAPGSWRDGHPHTPDHQLECYTLIFPLYVAGRSDALPDVRLWAIKQLRYMGSHFYIRNAETVAQILERETDVSPWEVYALLGGYAFGF